MHTFIINYDLLKQGQNYEALWAELRRLQAVRVQDSSWMVRSTSTALQIANQLWRTMDGNDRLFVAQITSDYAHVNLKVAPLAA